LREITIYLPASAQAIDKKSDLLSVKAGVLAVVLVLEPDSYPVPVTILELLAELRLCVNSDISVKIFQEIVLNTQIGVLRKWAIN